MVSMVAGLNMLCSPGIMKYEPTSKCKLAKSITSQSTLSQQQLRSRHQFSRLRPRPPELGLTKISTIPLGKTCWQLAAESDVSIIFPANNKEPESESFDRGAMSLSPLQDELIRKVSGAAPKSVLVNQTGSPIAMPWIEKVDSILQCWYAGQKVGNALADIISGEISPSAMLPVTFPRCIEDSPSFGNFPADHGMEI